MTVIALAPKAAAQSSSQIDLVAFRLGRIGSKYTLAIGTGRQTVGLRGQIAEQVGDRFGGVTVDFKSDKITLAMVFETDCDPTKVSEIISCMIYRVYVGYEVHDASETITNA